MANPPKWAKSTYARREMTPHGPNVIYADFGEIKPTMTDRETRLEQIARACANMLLAGVHGDIDTIDDQIEFLTEAFEELDTPLEQGDVDNIYRRAIQLANEMEEK